MITVNITPIPKPRMTRRDKWLNPPRACVSAYWAFKDELNFQLARFGFERNRDTLFAKVVVAFPKSYSKKKMQSLDGMPHRLKPDTDNFIKAICDAMMKDDKKVHTNCVTKVWGYTPQIIFYDSLLEMIVEGGFSGIDKENKSKTGIDFDKCPLSVPAGMIEEFWEKHPEMKGSSVQGALNSLAFAAWKYKIVQ